MAVKRTVITAIVGQFGHPRGAAGSVARWVMAHRRSNRQRNSRVVALLDVQPTEKVLEIGFGPGLANRRAEPLRRPHRARVRHRPLRGDAPPGGQAQRRRHRRRAGHPEQGLGRSDSARPRRPLRHHPGCQLPWVLPAPAERLGELRRRLRPGGRIAIASQPRTGARAQTARQIEALLQDAGYPKTRTESLDLEPPVACILADNPDPACYRSPPASDLTSLRPVQ